MPTAGLYLQVSGDDWKSWIFRFTLNGRAREMGLGPLKTIGLSDARAKASDCRRQIQEGIDSIEARKASRDSAKLELADLHALPWGGRRGPQARP